MKTEQYYNVYKRDALPNWEEEWVIFNPYHIYYFHLEVRSKKINSGTSLKIDAWYSSTCKIGTFSSVCEIIYEAADRITESVRALIYLRSSPNFEMGPFRDSVSPKY